MKIINFGARTGSPFSNKQAQIYGKRIYEIKNSKGQIRPEDVVADGQNKNSPLHDYFEWDNNIASKKYRIHQARMLLSSIMIAVKTEDNKSLITKAFFNISKSRTDRMYVDFENTFSNEDYSLQVVRQAMKELESWTEKYKNYKELKAIIQKLKRMIEV